jgi:hypothetical protein
MGPPISSLVSRPRWDVPWRHGGQPSENIHGVRRQGDAEFATQRANADPTEMSGKSLDQLENSNDVCTVFALRPVISYVQRSSKTESPNLTTGQSISFWNIWSKAATSGFCTPEV